MNFMNNYRWQSKAIRSSFLALFIVVLASLAVVACGTVPSPGGDGGGDGGGFGPDTSKQGTWTPLPAFSASALYNGITFAGSSDSKKVVVGVNVNGEQFNIWGDSGTSWVKRSPPTGSEMFYLRGLASSADGGKLAAAFIGHIYTSDNSGATWTDVSPADGDASGNLLWGAVVSSADGSKLVAYVGGTSGGHIYTYSDSGRKWTDRTKSSGEASGNLGWTAIACSTDCTRIAATTWGLVHTPSIYTSDDFGETWHDRSLTNSNLKGFDTFTSIASSSDGKFLVATAYLTTMTPAVTQITVFTSDNYGNSWTPRTPPELSAKFPFQTFPYLRGTSSNDGSRIAIAAIVGTTSYVFTSSDYGNKWTKQTLPEIPPAPSKSILHGGYAPFSDGSTLIFAQLEYPPVSVDTKNNSFTGNPSNFRMYTLTFP